MSASDVTRVLRLGVPREHGGVGGCLRDAVEATASVAARDPADAAKLWAQRVLIEYLLHSPNVALRDYQLPALLERSIAGTAALWPLSGWSPARAPVAVVATDTGRGWHLDGHLPAIPNLDNDWYVAAIPIIFPASSTYSVGLVSSEQDGVSRADGLTTLQLRRVHFREDELIALDGPSLLARTHLNFQPRGRTGSATAGSGAAPMGTDVVEIAP